MGTIGDNKQLRLTDIKDAIRDEDADAVKTKIDRLKVMGNRSSIAGGSNRGRDRSL
jgi:hypothetical protein